MRNMMRGFLHSCRGAVAMTTVAVAIPLIGMISLGTEVGGWYVVKRHAQNSADGAAYAGALSLAAGVDAATIESSQTVEGFCKSCSQSNGVTQTYQVSVITWNGRPAVQATVEQQQPPYVIPTSFLPSSSPLLVGGKVRIPAIAIAALQPPITPCGLALTGPLSFQGGEGISTQNCQFVSDSTASGSINFTGNPNLPPNSISTAGGCTGTGQATLCNGVSKFQPIVPDPFAALDKAIRIPSNLTVTPGGGPGTISSNCASLTAYNDSAAATRCVNNTVTIGSDTPLPTAGVYFFSGTLTVKKILSGSNVVLVLLPGAHLVMQGSGQISVTSPLVCGAGVVSPCINPTTQLPARLRSVASLLSRMSLYIANDPTPNTGGNPWIKADGTIYAPNSDLTFQGTPAVTSLPGTCFQVIAATIHINGSPNLDNTACPNKPQLQYVALVQ